MLQPGHFDEAFRKEMDLFFGKHHRLEIAFLFLSAQILILQKIQICLNIGKGRPHLVGDLRDQVFDGVPVLFQTRVIPLRHALQPEKLVGDLR